MFRTGMIYAFNDWRDAQMNREGDVVSVRAYDPGLMKRVTREYRVVLDGESINESGQSVKRKFWELVE